MSAINHCVPLTPRCRQVSAFITLCRVIVTMMTGNPTFPDATSLLALLTTFVNDLDAKEQLAQKRGKGMAQERNAALRCVERVMRQLVAHVCSISDAHPDEEAAAIILSAGMAVGKKGAWIKQAFRAKHGKVSGSAVLEAKAIRGPVQYQWQMSDDQITWTDLPHTFVSSASVQGPTRAKVYFFRFRSLTKLGLSDWSDAISILAL